MNRPAAAAVLVLATLWGGGGHAAAPVPEGTPVAGDLAVPGEAPRLRALARTLAAGERYAEAADAFARAGRLSAGDPDPDSDPDSDVVAHMAVLVRLGRMAEARAVAEDARRAPVLPQVARAMIEAGEFGRARSLLDTALAQTPDSRDLLTERARVEAAAGRPVRAVAYLEEAARQSPTDGGVIRALVQGLTAAGMPVRAVQAFEAAVAGGVGGDEALLAAVVEAMQAYGDHRAVLDLAEAHAGLVDQSAPLSRAVARSLAAIGARERAAERLRQALALAPPDAKTITLLDEVLPAAVSAPILEDLRRRFPSMPGLFHAGGTPPRDQAWVWLHEAAAMDRPRAAAHLSRGLDRVAGIGKGRMLLRLAELEETPEAALAHIGQADTLGVALGDVLAARFRVLAAAGRWDAAAPVAWDWSRVRPDAAAALDALFVPEVAERIGWARVFAHLHDHVERAPEDPDRRLQALKRHMATGGSAVLALVHAQALERLAGGDDPRHAEGRRLGEELRRMLEQVGRLVDVDFEDARIVLDTGEGPLEARFHPVTGRLLRFAVGERWIAARWSPDGLTLEGLSDWRGNAVTAIRRDSRLAAIEAVGSGAFHAELGADGTPTAVTGAGTATDRADAYNAAIALLSAWPRTGLAGARWLSIGVR